MKYRTQDFFYRLFTSVLFQTAMANDGFYQGGGSSLRPLNNPQMRVIEEKLLIHPMPQPVCYRLRFRGQFLEELKPDQLLYNVPLKPDEFAEIADSTVCKKDEMNEFYDNQLLSLWQAQAEYHVEALADQNSVQMGFPLPIWWAHYFDQDTEWKQELPVPAAVNFRTFINGKLVENPRLTWLNVPDPAAEVPAIKTLGFVWQASFKKGEKYTLRTEYDFGSSYQAYDFGRNYQSGDFSVEKLPWFIAANENEEGIDEYLSALGLFHYLIPLRTWGTQAPERISIQVKRPPGVPSTYLVPITPKPVCVDTDSLHYEYRNRYPDSKLEIYMPLWFYDQDDFKSWPDLKNPDQWQRWQQTLGGKPVSITCEVLDEVSAPDNFTCVKQCQTETIKPTIMLPRFEDFPALETYTGKPATPDVKSQPKAWEFRTMLRENAKDGVNFAGRYVLASWGCGSGCLDGGIIDTKTGQVYFDPFLDVLLWPGPGSAEFQITPESEFEHFRFRSNSRLLVTFGTPNKPGSIDIPTLKILLWEQPKLRLLYTAYGSLPEDSYDDYYEKIKTFNQDDWSLLSDLLDDGIHHAGEHAKQLVAKLLAKHPQKEVGQRDHKTAHAANEKGLAAIEKSLNKEDLNIAAQWFEKAVKADSEDVEVLNNLGYVYLLQGKPEAADKLRNVLMLDPHRVNAWVNLGQYFASQNNIDSAVGCFNLGLRLSSNRDKTIAFLRQLPEKLPSPTLSQAVQKTLQQDWIKPKKANLEEQYLETRDNFIHQFKKENKEDVDGKQAFPELQKQLETIIGPIEVEGFPKQGEINIGLDTLLNSGLDANSLDGLRFDSEKECLVVTTEKLLNNYLIRHPELSKNRNELSIEGDFHTWVCSQDAAVVHYTDLPIKSVKGQSFARAFLGIYSQDPSAISAPTHIFIFVSRADKIFLVSAATKVKINEIPQCINEWKQEGKGEYTDEAANIYYRCFRREAKKESFFPLLTKQAQSIVDRLLNSAAQKTSKSTSPG
jgi:tetratricopeptide (TPR) repeat protein